MGADHSQRGRKADAKYSTKQPIAAIEKRVIDSDAFAALPASAVVVLLLLARNLNKGMNGHVFLSQKDGERHGIARKTLYRNLRTLVAAGFIYPTKHSGDGQCGNYALTWLSLSKDTKGLHLDNFRLCAYRDGTPQEKKRGVKLSPGRGQKCTSDPDRGDKKGLSGRDKNALIELIPHSVGGLPGLDPALSPLEVKNGAPIKKGNGANLDQRAAERGLTRDQGETDPHLAARIAVTSARKAATP